MTVGQQGAAAGGERKQVTSVFRRLWRKCFLNPMSIFIMGPLPSTRYHFPFKCCLAEAVESCWDLLQTGTVYLLSLWVDFSKVWIVCLCTGIHCSKTSCTWSFNEQWEPLMPVGFLTLFPVVGGSDLLPAPGLCKSKGSPSLFPVSHQAHRNFLDIFVSQKWNTEQRMLSVLSSSGQLTPSTHLANCCQKCLCGSVLAFYSTIGTILWGPG